jgi:hypothetical protein
LGQREVKWSIVLIEYYSVYQIEKNEVGGTCSTYGEEERCIQRVGGETKENKPPGRPRRRWQESSKLDLAEVRWGGLDWVHLVQIRDT